MAKIHFWNGNKSQTRQLFELTLLRRVLQASHSVYANSEVIDDRTDYPDADDEGAVFSKGADVCVTVAGNPKFNDGDYLSILEPLMNGLLGHRLLVIRDKDAQQFATIKSITELKSKVHGIPATWADAELFRNNGYTVNERGSLDELFHRLTNKECDYVALGVNEIQAIFQQYAKHLGGLVIENTLRLYYPYALVFYVNPENQHLALNIEKGLLALKSNGIFNQLFQSFFGELITNAKLQKRRLIQLQNRALPQPLQGPMKTCHEEIIL